MCGCECVCVCVEGVDTAYVCMYMYIWMVLQLSFYTLSIIYLKALHLKNDMVTILNVRRQFVGV